MAYGVLPPPGAKYGPCLAPCEHRDCRATREQAASICPFCLGPIAYDQAFWKVDGAWAHVQCTPEPAPAARQPAR